ncbi:MAG: phage tail sheath family protein, partial [Pseudomonadota bacterium]
MSQMKTPGVYVVESDAFPNSVVAVPTAVPAFVGYTETAQRGATDVTHVPVRLSSLAEFEDIYGGAPKPMFKLEVTDEQRVVVEADPTSRFNLYNGMRLFFDNGGGPCWIVSVGSYGVEAKRPDHFGEAVWEALSKEAEPTMVVIPDAVLMPDLAAYKAVWDKAFAHCTAMRKRVAVIDVFNGDKTRNDPSGVDVIRDFRDTFTYDDLSYGVAYYPWLHTSVYSSADISYANIHEDSRAGLANHIKSACEGADNGAAVATLADTMAGDDASAATVTATHQALLVVSARYKDVMQALLRAINVMPPAAAMAGVFTRTDNTVGVFKAPANTGLVSVVSPCVALSHDEQEDLNVPLDGKAVNAIRYVTGRGLLVWGAWTLDGNSQDWRYINVR